LQKNAACNRLLRGLYEKQYACSQRRVKNKMNRPLSNIELLIQQSTLPDKKKQQLLKEIAQADKQWNILESELGKKRKDVDVEGVTLVKMRGGKIAEEQDFFDNYEFMKQLGLIK
jgi:hypothetical protein